MRNISSEEHIVPMLDEAAVAWINESVDRQLAEIPVGVAEHIAIRINISVSVPDGTRLSKDTTMQLYRSMVAKSSQKEWRDEKSGFFFDFDNDVFKWDDRELYFTATERLIFFRILVLKERFYGNDKYHAMQTIRSARNRLGMAVPSIKL